MKFSRTIYHFKIIILNSVLQRYPRFDNLSGSHMNCVLSGDDINGSLGSDVIGLK